MGASMGNRLNACEIAVGKAKDLLGRHEYPDDLRTIIVAGFVDTIIEHHASVLLLICSEKIGSAFALLRSIFEGMYRGLWLGFCATDADIQQFKKEDKFQLTQAEMAGAIDEKYRAEGFFADLKQRAWPALNSYAHTGMLQLERRYTGHELKPAYDDAEISEVIISATTCVLTLVSKFLAVQGFADDAREAEKLIGSYGLAAGRPAGPSR